MFQLTLHFYRCLSPLLCQISSLKTLPGLINTHWAGLHQDLARVCISIIIPGLSLVCSLLLSCNCWPVLSVICRHSGSNGLIKWKDQRTNIPLIMSCYSTDTSSYLLQENAQKSETHSLTYSGVP